MTSNDIRSLLAILKVAVLGKVSNVERKGILHGSNLNLPSLVLLSKNSFMASVYGVLLFEVSGNSADTLSSIQIVMLGSCIPFPGDVVIDIDVWFSV